MGHASYIKLWAGDLPTGFVTTGKGRKVIVHKQGFSSSCGHSYTGVSSWRAVHGIPTLHSLIQEPFNLEL